MTDCGVTPEKEVTVQICSFWKLCNFNFDCFFCVPELESQGITLFLQQTVTLLSSLEPDLHHTESHTRGEHIDLLTTTHSSTEEC